MCSSIFSDNLIGDSRYLRNRNIAVSLSGQIVLVQLIWLLLWVVKLHFVSLLEAVCHAKVFLFLQHLAQLWFLLSINLILLPQKIKSNLFAVFWTTNLPLWVTSVSTPWFLYSSTIVYNLLRSRIVENTIPLGHVIVSVTASFGQSFLNRNVCTFSCYVICVFIDFLST